ncbi:MAG: ComEA family DNA-binding protein [Chloroflexota bacterium]
MNESSKPLTAVFLVMLLATLLIIGMGCQNSGEVEIYLPPAPEIRGTVYIGGSVANPGYYPLISDDSVEALIQAAGGATGEADFSRLRLYLPALADKKEPQKIDINLAEAWLLEALPGIGEVTAGRIIEYRERNGPFRTTSELTKVEGIGISTYEKIKGLITVSE